MSGMNEVSLAVHAAGFANLAPAELKQAVAKHVLQKGLRDLDVARVAEYMGVHVLTKQELIAMVHVTKAQAIALTYGGILHHAYKRNRDGTPMRVRVTGKCKTWKTRPEEFKLPVMYGLYESGYVTHENCGEWYVA